MNTYLYVKKQHEKSFDAGCTNYKDSRIIITVTVDK